MDDYGRTTQATLGTSSASWSYDANNQLSGISATGVQGYGYVFDANTGNLNSRTNTILTKSDNFGYDTENLDRLTLMTPTANLDPTSITYTSNKNGNIQTKSDVGTYVYDATQPYAVDQITGGLNISNDLQSIEYYSFEKVKKITEGEGATQRTADFDYNADQQRIRMVLKTNGTTTRTKYYFGSSCEREVVAGVTTQYIWIGGDAYTAVAVAKKVGTGAWTVYNIFRDHLGTITHLKNGDTVTEYNFDAWGRRRDKDDWTYTLTSEPTLFADRGFTGHEYLEDFKLYNMNGRLYDPVVGRFLSPDPYIQDPGFTQSLNRYSYCLNNPLKFTDPTGEKWNWNWLNPLYHFENFMQWVNDKTPQLRQNMAKAGIPPFGVGTSVNFAGNVNYNASIYGQQVFNTANIDRSNAEQKVNKAIDNAQIWRGAWMEASGNGNYYSGEIKQFEPNIFDRYTTTKFGSSILGKMIYGVFDDIGVTASSLILGHNNAFHLNGAGTIGNETVDSAINTMTNFVPVGSFDSFLGIGEKTLNAGQFNSLYKGSGITAAKDGGKFILNYNYNVMQSLQIGTTLGVLSPGFSIFGYFWSYY